MGKRIKMLCYFCTASACTPLIYPSKEINQVLLKH